MVFSLISLLLRSAFSSRQHELEDGFRIKYGMTNRHCEALVVAVHKSGDSTANPCII